MEAKDNEPLRRIIWNTVAEMFGLDSSQTSNAAVIFQAQTYTVLTLPAAATFPQGLIYVSNESGGATLAFSDGANWRRVQDRVIVS